MIRRKLHSLYAVAYVVSVFIAAKHKAICRIRSGAHLSPTETSSWGGPHQLASHCNNLQMDLFWTDESLFLVPVFSSFFVFHPLPNFRSSSSCASTWCKAGWQQQHRFCLVLVACGSQSHAAFGVSCFRSLSPVRTRAVAVKFTISCLCVEMTATTAASSPASFLGGNQSTDQSERVGLFQTSASVCESPICGAMSPRTALVSTQKMTHFS